MLLLILLLSLATTTAHAAEREFRSHRARVGAAVGITAATELGGLIGGAVLGGVAASGLCARSERHISRSDTGAECREIGGLAVGAGAGLIGGGIGGAALSGRFVGVPPRRTTLAATVTMGAGGALLLVGAGTGSELLLYAGGLSFVATPIVVGAVVANHNPELSLTIAPGVSRDFAGLALKGSF